MCHFLNMIFLLLSPVNHVDEDGNPIDVGQNDNDYEKEFG